jgi:hypothetical protein
MVYKPAVAHFGSELSSIFLANFDYATIDKTLFYESNTPVLKPGIDNIINIFGL